MALPCATIGLAINSCTKLDDKVYSTIVANKYNYTENDLVRLLGNAYTPWRGAVDQMLTTTQEISTDEELVPVHPWGWNGTTINMHLHNWTSETGEATGRWGELYSGITNCNQVLYQIQSGLVPVSSGKEAYIAELKTLRASYYYLLDDYYGNVPYVTSFNLPKGYAPKQITRAALTDSLISEVKTALPNLSDKVDASTYGRFTKWGGLALLAKLYLNAQVYKGTPMWNECLDACNQIIASGKFALAANHKDPFKADNASNAEAIFAIPFDQSYAGGLNLFNYYLNGQYNQVYKTINGYGGWGGNVAMPQFVNTYDMDDTRLNDDYLYGQQKYPDGSNVVVGTGTVYSGQPMNIANLVPSLYWAEEVHGYHLQKYEYVSGMTAGSMNNDVFLFRYTDVMMMKAECLLRTGQADQAAVIVSQIRQRAFKNTPAKATVTGAQLTGGSSYDYGLRETNFATYVTNARTTHEGGADITYGRFFDELGWEFNQEGRRRQDMIRFGVWTKKSWLSHQATNDPNKNLYPIPNSEIAKNPNLKQNPGY